MLRKYASAKLQVVSGERLLAGVPKQASASSSSGLRSFGSFDFQPKPGFIYTRTRAISARVNKNYDGFPSSELKLAYKTFEGRPVFVNHNNHDTNRARGVILSSQFFTKPDDHWIGLLTETDALTFPRLAKDLVSGDLDSVSMGCDVARSICSYCDNVATKEEEFCGHILHHKGQVLPRVVGGRKESVLVYEICRGLGFFEISYVFDPADETALMEEVLVPGGLRV